MPVIYSKPVIGPRAYVAQTNSGWTESFDKKKADRAILDFLTPLDPAYVAGNFVDKLRLSRVEQPLRQVLWEDLVSYLADIKQCSKAIITGMIGMGFWAAVLGLQDDGERAFN